MLKPHIAYCLVLTALIAAPVSAQTNSDTGAGGIEFITEQSPDDPHPGRPFDPSSIRMSKSRWTSPFQPVIRADFDPSITQTLSPKSILRQVKSVPADKVRPARLAVAGLSETMM